MVHEHTMKSESKNCISWKMKLVAGFIRNASELCPEADKCSSHIRTPLLIAFPAYATSTWIISLHVFRLIFRHHLSSM
jgi:hypothetical protein